MEAEQSAKTSTSRLDPSGVLRSGSGTAEGGIMIFIFVLFGQHGDKIRIVFCTSYA